MDGHFHIGTESGVRHLFAPERFPPKKRREAAALWSWTEAVGLGRPTDGLREEAIEIAREAGGALESVDSQRRAADALEGRRRFEHFTEIDAVLEAWPIPHGRLLARVAGLGQSWRQPMLDDLWRSSFLARRLRELPREGPERLWIPIQECERTGADPERLIAGDLGEAERQLLWKQVVRIRERLVHALPLSQDLERPFKHGFKLFWFGLLELLDEIERRDFDLWTEPVALSRGQRQLINLQSLLTRATFKRV